MVIKKPTSETKTIASLLSELDNKYTTIDLDAAYQRCFVWTEKKQKYFIDSIMSNLAPSVITVNLNTKTGKKVCIDGKQRLTSIKRFCDNKFCVKISEDSTKDYYFSEKGEDTECKVLSEKQKSHFFNCNLFVVTYSDLTYEQQIDLFKRLQSGDQVQSGEKISCVINDEENCKRFNEYCDSQKKYLERFTKVDRSEHKTLVSRLLLFVKNESVESIQKYKTDKIVKDLFEGDDPENIKNKTSIAIEKIFNIFKIGDISKSINNNIILISFHKLYQKYNNNWKKLNNDRFIIIETITKLHKSKLTSGTTEDSLKIIAAKFDKYFDEASTHPKKSKTDDDIKLKRASVSSDTNSDSDSDKDSEKESDSDDIKHKKIKKNNLKNKFKESK